jgi:hypothetical protein
MDERRRPWLSNSGSAASGREGVNAKTAKELEFLDSLAGLATSSATSTSDWESRAPVQTFQSELCTKNHAANSLHRPPAPYGNGEDSTCSLAKNPDVELSGCPMRLPNNRGIEGSTKPAGTDFPSDSPTIPASSGPQSTWRRSTTKWSEAKPGTSSVRNRSMEDGNRTPLDSSAPFHLRASSAFKSSTGEILGGAFPSSPTFHLRARRFNETLPETLATQSASFKRAASRASSVRSAISGRANIGSVVDDHCDAMDMLLAVEASIYNTMRDPETRSRPVTCSLNDEDYKHNTKVMKTRQHTRIDRIDRIDRTLVLHDMFSPYPYLDMISRVNKAKTSCMF